MTKSFLKFCQSGEILPNLVMLQFERIKPSVSAPSCHLLGKINAMETFFSTIHLCLQSKWLTMMEITDVMQRRMFSQHLFCPVDGRTVLRVLGWGPQAAHDKKFRQLFSFGRNNKTIHATFQSRPPYNFIFISPKIHGKGKWRKRL